MKCQCESILISCEIRNLILQIHMNKESQQQN